MKFRKSGKAALLLMVLLPVVGSVVAQDTDKEPSEADALVAESEKLLTRLDQYEKEIAEWEAMGERFEGDDRRAVELEITEKKLNALEDLHELAGNLLEQEALGLDTTELRARIEATMQEVSTLVRERIQVSIASATELSNRRDEAAPEDLLDLERQLAREQEQVQRIIGIYFDHVQAMEEIGLDTTEQRDFLEAGLKRFSSFLSRHIELTLDKMSDLELQVAKNPEDSALKTERSALEERRDSQVASLRSVIKIMKELDLDTSQQSELVARTTGDVVEMLDKDVALGLIGEMLKQSRSWLSENGPRMLLKGVVILLILLVFRVLAGMARRLAVRAMRSSRVTVSKLLLDMITSAVGRVVMILGLLVALSQVGVSLGPLLAGLGVAGFIVGFALQDTLSNFASGMMILFYRPFDVDDIVEAGGVMGRVNRMTLVSTTILTFDYETLVVPNNKIWGDVIKNITAQKIRRVDLTFGISYKDDISHAERVLKEIVSAHEKILQDPEPVIRLNKLNESSVDFIVWPWVATKDFFQVRWDLTREVKLRFDKEGINIPFPQRDVHLFSEKAVPA